MLRIGKVGFAAAWLLMAATACSDRMGDVGQVEIVLRDAVEDIRATQSRSLGVVIPGLAAAALVDGGPSEPVPAVASGAANPPGDRPLTQADRFLVGSITKT